MADVRVVQKNHSIKSEMRTYHIIDMIQEHGDRHKDNPELDC